MGKITKVEFGKGKDEDRVDIHIDNKWCCRVRERTFPALKVELGTHIDCKTLKDRESFAFKNAYSGSWEKEKERIKYVVRWLEKYIDYDLDYLLTGFGADSTELIFEHPDEKGEPDITIKLTGTDVTVLFLEVSGTDYMRGTDYWVRKDKIEYIQSHGDMDTWVALVYLPLKKIIWIRVNLNKEYATVKQSINNIGEFYVSFDEGDEEVKTSEEFKSYLDAKCAKLLG